MKSRLLTITLAAVLALLGAVAVLAYVRQANNRAVAGQKAETVIVASGAITAGTSLSEAKVKNELAYETVPASSLSEGAVQHVTNANEHQVVSANVAKGQVLFQNMLAKPGTLTAGSNGPVLPLPPGDIEVTMEICLDADVAGYVQPGDDVAVFDTVATGGYIQYTCTTHQPPSGKGKIGTVVVAAKVEVLSVTPASSQGASSAAGQSTADPPDPALPVASGGEVLVTLAATSQAQAESLMFVNNVGDPSLGLLSEGSIINTSLQPVSQP